MNNIFLKVCISSDLIQFQSQLLSFEKEFIYPLTSTENFYISHGADYTRFFERMGDSRYLLAFDGDSIVGMIAVVKKTIYFQGKSYQGFYLADLKIKQSYRGQGIAKAIYWKLLTSVPKYRYAWRWSFCYFVGMVGAKGDVSRAFSGSLPTKLIHSLGYLNIYFVEPSQLKGLSEQIQTQIQASQTLLNAQYPKRLNMLNLSSANDTVINKQATRDLLGIKDIVLQHTGNAMNLCHINLHNLSDTEVIEHLAKSILSDAKTLKTITSLDSSDERDEKNRGTENQLYEQYCFAIDERRTALIDTLAKLGINSESRAHVQGFSLKPGLLKHDYFSLNTDEI